MMARYLLDTNILLRLVGPNSSQKPKVVDAIVSLAADGHDLIVASQCLAEFWVVASRPGDVNGFGWSPSFITQEIDQILSRFELVEEEPGCFTEWLGLMQKYQVTGKRAHDLRLVALMLHYDISRLVTLNPKDFRKIIEIATLCPGTP